jgi:soluble lytic murein transglycosylase-like protein
MTGCARRGGLLLAAAFMAAVIPVVQADETVIFRNGRRMRVVSSEREGARYVLRMDGDGVIQVPANAVERIEADPAPAPQEKVGPLNGARLEEFFADQKAGALRHLIRRAALDHQLDEELLAAVIFTESSFDPEAVSPKGAMGLMQLMPGTATRFGVQKPFDPWENLNGGAAYLRQLREKYGGDLKLALAAYNAGEGRVEAYHGMPPFSETINYVSRVIGLYMSFRDGG